MDLHAGFRDPGQSAPAELTRFLSEVDRLPGIQAIRRALWEAVAPAPGRRILDAGCGTGLEARRLARAGAEVVGLDRNGALLPGTGDVEWVEGDLTAVRLAPFDAIRTERVLIYADDLEASVGALARLLKPGGRIALFELDYGATILAPGGASDTVLARAGAALYAALPQPDAGRRIPGLLAGLTDVTATPFSFSVSEPVWRRIVGDTLRDLDKGLNEWLQERGEAAARGEFVAAFTGVLSTARRARFRGPSGARARAGRP
jgi:SAM-dependent methyltransferase